MFTGIVQAVGTIKEIVNKGKDYSFSIETPEQFLVDTKLGDSISVQGVCLTVVSIKKNIFTVDVSNETLQCTTLGDKKENARVNLELALTLATKLGGHLVSGHVDGVGNIKDIGDDGESVRVIVQSPADLCKYIARKGSICMDGVSLTVNEVDNTEFTVNIIPHTFQSTTINEYTIDTKINLEIDLIARYVERLQTHTPHGAL